MQHRRPIVLFFYISDLFSIQWNTIRAGIHCSLALCIKNMQPGKMSKTFLERPFFRINAVFAMGQSKNRVMPDHPCLQNPLRDLRWLTVFRVPTCCSWGKINVEQAKARNAFKAPLIELDGLQSHRQSVSTRLGLARSWDAPHTYTSLNRVLWLAAPRCRWTLDRQWELYGKLVCKEPPPPPFEMKVHWLSVKGKCSHAEAHWAGHWRGEHSSVIQFDLNPICYPRVSEYRVPHTGRKKGEGVWW